MIGLPVVHALLAVLFAGAAWFAAAEPARPARWRATTFWSLLALVFVAGDVLGAFATGLAVLGLAGLAACGLGAPAPADAVAPPARRTGARLFLPALAVPLVTLAGSVLLKGIAVGGRPLVDPRQVTTLSLALSVVAALVLLWPLLRPRPADPLRASAGLLHRVSWAGVLPVALAALGAVFAQAGVGSAVATLFGGGAALGARWAACLAYTGGMALFTVAMGNAFAAFPVMAAAVGLPVLVGRLHADPAAVGALGMLSGFCGTLLSPLAANFNVVPVALLELPDRWAVIRVQAPTAVVLWAVNTVLLFALAFPR